MKDQETKKYIKLGITGVAVIIVSLLCFFVLFRLSEFSVTIKTVIGIISPFIYGAVIAYILTPLCNRLEKLLTKLSRSGKNNGKLVSPLSIALSLLFAVALVLVLFVLIIPQVWDSIVNIVNATPGYLKRANEWLHDLLENHPEIQAYWDELYAGMAARVSDWLTSDLFATMGTVIGELSTHLSAFFITLKNLFLGLLISAYFLSNRKLFAVQARMLLHGILPRRWADLIEDEVRFADRMFNGFLMGKLLDSAIIGVICFVVTAILGFRSALLISVIVGTTNIIPFFGPFIGAIPCALLLLLQNPIHCLYFIIFIVILQQLDGNVIGPKILGNTTGLSSFWVLFAILLFGGLWGIFGMIVGVPLFAVIYDIIRRLILFGLHKHGREELIEEYNEAFHPTQEGKKQAKKSDRKRRFFARIRKK